MKLAYSRNKKPVGNQTPGMEFAHVRDEPARIVHVQSPTRPEVTLCGAPVNEDPVPEEIVLPNCGNCFQLVRRARRTIAKIERSVGI